MPPTARTTISPNALPAGPPPVLSEDATKALVAAGLDPADVRWAFVVPVAEAALRLGLSTPSVYGAILRNQIPSLKLGRRRTIPREAFEKWLKDATARNEGMFA